MQFYISYFYQIRNFAPNMIPISTAVSDPKWFHENRSLGHNFLDRNRVINGLRAEELVPGKSCSNLCHGREKCYFHPSSCNFLQNYYAQLQQIDFPSFIQKMTKLGEEYARQKSLVEEPIIVFMVYETPDNPCSERVMLQRWFKENGIMLWNWKPIDK